MLVGENQNSYNDFLSTYETHIQFISLKRQTIKGEALKLQSLSHSRAFSNQRKKFDLAKKRADLVRNQYSKQRTLYDKGVISHSELLNFEEKMLSAEEIAQQEEKSLFLLKVQSNEIETASQDNTLNLLEISNQNLKNLKGARQILLSEINLWEEQNLLMASQAGRVSTFDIWEKYQSVEKDDYVFSIVPLDHGKIIGKLQVPISNTGKVSKANKVLIKLDNYPFREWGTLKGNIVHISEVPKRKSENIFYSMYIEIDDLNTSFNKKIHFKQEMSGKAEIILQKRSILSMIFFHLRSISE